MKRLYEILSCLDSHIELMELNDHAYTKDYTHLVRERRAIKRAIRKIERIEKRKDEK